ncbi:hypothetical protein PCASD_15036 [Puccinia coronata f. sp. avenae]|uniref:Uncharacterized protein n=1 Tax=Puccinia coronata f. sp. avenae TaxID=200324 RepID=A0A2N5TD91_9BASI|nr:hypothetical protein PCASD_13634 [Puccinia coronata f. sp. avenae]PLW34218.1 hypothetical protein PCASD_15036 [Puccinia coronata f. sp. avenae]
MRRIRTADWIQSSSSSNLKYSSPSSTLSDQTLASSGSLTLNVAFDACCLSFKFSSSSCSDDRSKSLEDDPEAPSGSYKLDSSNLLRYRRCNDRESWYPVKQPSSLASRSPH